MKVFNWLFTLYRGRLTFTAPMLWAMGALFLLLIGGVTGMMLAIPAVNYTVHNSVFVIAHFHCMVLLIAYSIFAATGYWFPKVFGFRLDERSGKAFFYTFSLGTAVLFIAMFALGFMGETRRLDYLYNTQWMPALVVEEIGVGFYTLSCYYFAKMLYVSIRDRVKNRVGADAWGTSRTLEWLTHSPVPFYNFAVTPQVNTRDELSWRYANNVADVQPDHYEAFHMPNNTVVPLLIGVLGFGFGFGMVWRIWWMAGLSLLAIIAVVIYRSFARDKGYILTAEALEKLEKANKPLGVVAETQYLTESNTSHLTEAEAH